MGAEKPVEFIFARLLGSVVLLGADVPGMSLTSNNRPVFGATWSLTAGNFDPSSTLGVSIFGLSDPGINDLFFLGALFVVVTLWLPNGVVGLWNQIQEKRRTAK